MFYERLVRNESESNSDRKCLIIYLFILLFVPSVRMELENCLFSFQPNVLQIFSVLLPHITGLSSIDMNELLFS